MKCANCELDGIITQGHCANCRAKYRTSPMIAQGYNHVRVENSRSRYGKWAVKYSPSTIRFFWTRHDAEMWAQAYNSTCSHHEPAIIA